MGVVLGAPLRANLFSLLKTQALIDQTQFRLSTGKKVNSALDDPNAYFASFALSNRARDLNNLLDNVEQNIQTIKAADAGLRSLEGLLEQAEAITNEVLATKAFASPESLNAQILSSNPVGYWRLNETSGINAVNLGSGGAAIRGRYQNGVALGQTPLYSNGGEVSAGFDGVNDRVRIPNSSLINTTAHGERTIELVFNADNLSGRQVLYEEGGGTNALAIYIEDGRVYVNGRDAGDWGPFTINRPISAGQTYHVALVLDEPNGELRGYLDGELMGTGTVTRTLSSHSGGIGIGRMNGASHFHDGAQGGNGLAFQGRIGEVALYNDVLSESELSSHANALNPTPSGIQFAQDLEVLKTQIDQTAFDASYRGTNLLQRGTLTTPFNETGTSFLNTVGDDFSTVGLYLEDISYANEQETQLALSAIKSALNEIRSFSASLATERSILKIRNTHLRETINILQEGSDKLVLADMNEESAKLLALKTSQDLGVTSLQLASEAKQSILQLFDFEVEI